MKKLLPFLIFVLVLALGYGYYEYSKGPRDLQREKTEIVIEANKLLKAFENNEKEANALYLDKVIAVSGTIIEIKKGEVLKIVLETGSPMSTIICEMASNEYPTHSVGDIVSVKGQCTGYLMDVIMVKSLIINE